MLRVRQPQAENDARIELSVEGSTIFSVRWRTRDGQGVGPSS